MKRIAYMTPFLYERDADGEIVTEKILKFRSIPYSPENIEIAKREAYNGEYTIEDDGQPEPPPTTEQRVADLEEQLAQSDETAIALYEAQEAQETINAQQDEALMEIYEMIG